VPNWGSARASRVYGAILRVGWRLKRQKGSHRRLERDGWPDATFAFHDGDEIGPVMMAKLGEQFGFGPDDV
jgi:predicted RNA binding protein YcfA (HicA-like mRNA interferase family)